MRSVIFLVVIAASQIPARAQSESNSGTTQWHRNATEIRLGPSENSQVRVAFEQRLHVMPAFSVDVSMLLFPTSFQIGASLWPADFIGVQAAIGTGGFTLARMDAPNIEPDYTYLASLALRLPLKTTATMKYYLTLVGGPVWGVDANHPYGQCFACDPQPVRYRAETFAAGRLELGLALAY